jgi:hypothetical protein
MNSEKTSPRGQRTVVPLGLAIALFVAPTVCSGEEITIEVAPATLNLKSNGTVVTVHTDVAYGQVDVATVYLQGVAINSWKADNRGFFVAKFLMEEIKTLEGLVIDGYNTLQFVALTIYDEEIWGEADVMVIDVGTGGTVK